MIVRELNGWYTNNSWILLILRFICILFGQYSTLNQPYGLQSGGCDAFIHFFFFYFPKHIIPWAWQFYLEKSSCLISKFLIYKKVKLLNFKYATFSFFSLLILFKSFHFLEFKNSYKIIYLFLFKIMCNIFKVKLNS
jgi:hypothetical protein